MRERSISGVGRIYLLLAGAIALIAVAVWGVSETQRNTANRVFEESHAAQRMLTAMLDQETGLRGYALTRRRSFLVPFESGGRNFKTALSGARSSARGDEQRIAIDRLSLTARRWRALAQGVFSDLNANPARPPDLSDVLARKAVFDDFRRQNAAFEANLAEERRFALARAGVISVAAIAMLSILFGGLGYFLISQERRRVRVRRAREQHERDVQTEFAETMQIMRDEPEAHEFVRRHLESTIEGCKVVVLNRDNSDSRLVAASATLSEPELTEKLAGADPDACLAVRLGRPYSESTESKPLLTCDLCGMSSTEVMCVPSLVGGEVIGSVLVRQDGPLGSRERVQITASLSQAAPVLGNLRNLAIAESRASTDALTGLPNSRSCRDNLERLVAQAGRTAEPLSAVMVDLDHFKQVNDRFGHGVGDDVLAMVGEALDTTLRGSDFGGRFGGEEFLVLLPSTGRQGALETAEKLRSAIEKLDPVSADLRVTASFGVATYPLDALDGDSLVRVADRALYAAKAEGRNRVVLADPTNAQSKGPGFASISELGRRER